MISAGEISKGMTVTIHHWEPMEVSGLFGDQPRMQTDRSWCGDVLEVVAVALPYVKVKLPDGGSYSLDTRRCTLMELPKEFADEEKMASRKPSPSKA